jgi:hypothetical protein
LNEEMDQIIFKISCSITIYPRTSRDDSTSYSFGNKYRL